MIRRTRMGHYVVDGDTGLARMVEHFATFDYPENLADLMFVSSLIPEGGVVIDAGACIGDQTGIYSQMVGATGHVYVFEPHPDSFEALKKNTDRLKNVTAIPMALTSNSMQLYRKLNLTPNAGASYLDGQSDETWPEHLVRVITLNDFDHAVIRLDRCDFIHLDAEGMETDILRGATNLIERFHPNLMVEVTDEWLKRYGSSEEDLLALLRSWGYRLQSRKGIGAQYDVVASLQIDDTLESLTKVCILSGTHE